jgi:hypothetical protein
MHHRTVPRGKPNASTALRMQPAVFSKGIGSPGLSPRPGRSNRNTGKPWLATCLASRTFWRWLPARDCAPPTTMTSPVVRATESCAGSVTMPSMLCASPCMATGCSIGFMLQQRLALDPVQRVWRRSSLGHRPVQRFARTPDPAQPGREPATRPHARCPVAGPPQA